MRLLSEKTGPAGENEPHNNMPPYVLDSLCETLLSNYEREQAKRVFDPKERTKELRDFIESIPE